MRARGQGTTTTRRSTCCIARSSRWTRSTVRPGNVLVPVRNPHSLGARRRRAADPRRPGRRRHDRAAARRRCRRARPASATRRRRTSAACSRTWSPLAERVGRPVRLLIVPARNVVDAIVGTVVRLRSSDVYVGESSTLSADDQARLLGEAWERADKPEAARRPTGHLSPERTGRHLSSRRPPASLTSGDLDLIHRLWLDAVKTVGPHVHHHDVVRAALTQMEQQLTGPQRDEALAAIRDVGTARRGARRGAPRARLRAAARHAAQPARRRRRRRC